jgi:serine/threonine protein kinase
MSQAALDLAERLLCYDPAARATAVQAMDAPYFTQEDPPAMAPVGYLDFFFAPCTHTDARSDWQFYRASGTNWTQNESVPKKEGGMILQYSDSMYIMLSWH